MAGKRLGRFSINAGMLDSHPEQCRQIMGRCVVLQCEHRYHSNCFEYIAVSPDFAEVEHGDDIPKYQAIFHSDGRVEFS